MNRPQEAETMGWPTDTQFRLTEEHVKLLGRANVEWDDSEYGAPTLSPKRPFGNSDVEGDVCEILGWRPEELDHDEQPLWSAEQLKRAAAIYHEIGTALQVVLVCRTFEPGLYVKANEYDFESWQRVPG